MNTRRLRGCAWGVSTFEHLDNHHRATAFGAKVGGMIGVVVTTETDLISWRLVRQTSEVLV